MSGLPGADAAISRQRGVFAAEHDQRPHERQLSRNRRAQRTGRNAEAVAEAGLAVDDGEGEVLDERRILQAVVENERVRAGFDRASRASDADPSRPSTARSWRAAAARRRPSPRYGRSRRRAAARRARRRHSRATRRRRAGRCRSASAPAPARPASCRRRRRRNCRRKSSARRPARPVPACAARSSVRTPSRPAEAGARAGSVFGFVQKPGALTAPPRRPATGL